MRAGRSLRISRKISKMHQQVLVFVKGDPKRATQVMGSGGWARAQGWLDSFEVTKCFGAARVEDGGGVAETVTLPKVDVLAQLRANDENFAAACMGQETYLFTPEEMAHTAAVHEAIARSAASGQPVMV